MAKKSSNILTTTNLSICPEDAGDMWNCLWTVTMKHDPERKLGTATFAGEKRNGTVPVRVELEERYRNQGYGTEVFSEMVEWAFLHKNVYEVMAVTDRENDKCIMALEKSGFVYRTKDGTMETYSVIKQKTTWLGLYIVIGITAGLALGIVLGSSWIGLAMGIVVGVAIGANMDARANKERERIVGKKEDGPYAP